MKDNENKTPAPQPKRGEPFQKITVTQAGNGALSLQPGSYYERLDNIIHVAVHEKEIVIETDERTYECRRPKALDSQVARPLDANDIKDVLDALGIDNVRELNNERLGKSEPWLVKGARK